MAKQKKQSGQRPKDKDESDDELVIDPCGKSEPVKVDIRAAFMGLAIVNFATDDDLGRGPRLTTCAINTRQMSGKRREDFVRAVGGDPHDYSKTLMELSRFDPQHAITVLVERRFIDQSSLVKNPLDIRSLDSLRRVEWGDKENFILSRATVANGNGRIDICRTVLAPKQCKDRRRILDLLKSNKLLASVPELQDRLDSVLRELDERASWLVAFYDLDMIPNNAHGVQIKLALAVNTPIYQVPDSEDEALDLILNNISFLPKHERLANLNNHTSLSLISCGPKRLTPVINNTAMILQVIDLYRYSQCWPGKSFCTNQLYSWRTGVSPFVEAVLQQGIMLLDYLSSNIDLPQDTTTICEIPDLDPYEDLFDDIFFEKVSECYVNHLYACRDSYGIPAAFEETGKIPYSNAYPGYVTNLTTEVGHWCESRRVRALETLAFGDSGDEITNILQGLPNRLQYALDVGLFNTAQYGLQLPTLPPVLCKYFVIDVGNYLMKYRHSIMEIVRMLEPMYCSVLVDARRDTEFKDQPTEMLCAWIARQEPGTSAPLTVVNECLSIIFKHRTSAILKIVAENRGLLPKYPSRVDLYCSRKSKSSRRKKNDDDDDDDNEVHNDPIWAEQYDALVMFMKTWRTAQAKGTSVKVLRDYAMAVYQPVDQMDLLCEMDYGDVLLKIVAVTALHWGAFSPSQLTSQIKTFAGYAINSLWMHVNHGLGYLARNEVWNLREELIACLSRELILFRGLWDGVGEQPGGSKPELTQTLGSVPRKLVLENVAMLMEGKVHETIKHIAHQILQKDLGAIPMESGGLTLTKAVHRAARNLFAEIAVASWKAQTMYIDNTVDRMESVTPTFRKELYLKLPIPETFKRASIEDIASYYDSLPEEALKSVNVSGTGSSREQVKVAREHGRRRNKWRQFRVKGYKSPESVNLEDLLGDEENLETIPEKPEEIEEWDLTPHDKDEEDRDAPPHDKEEEEEEEEDGDVPPHNMDEEEEEEDGDVPPHDMDDDEEEDGDVPPHDMDEEEEDGDVPPHDMEEEEEEDSEWDGEVPPHDMGDGDSIDEFEPKTAGGESRESYSAIEQDEEWAERRHKLKRKRLSSSPISPPLAQRRRLDSPDDSPEAEENIETPPGDNAQLMPPVAPKGQKTGLVSGSTPKSTVPRNGAKSPTPDFYMDGYDDDTLLELALMSDISTKLFKNVPAKVVADDREEVTPGMSQSHIFFMN